MKIRFKIAIAGLVSAIAISAYSNTKELRGTNL